MAGNGRYRIGKVPSRFATQHALTIPAFMTPSNTSLHARGVRLSCQPMGPKQITAGSNDSARDGDNPSSSKICLHCRETVHLDRQDIVLCCSALHMTSTRGAYGNSRIDHVGPFLARKRQRNLHLDKVRGWIEPLESGHLQALRIAVEASQDVQGISCIKKFSLVVSVRHDVGLADGRINLSAVGKR